MMHLPDHLGEWPASTVPYWKTRTDSYKNVAHHSELTLFRARATHGAGSRELIRSGARRLSTELASGDIRWCDGRPLASRWSTQKVRRSELLREAGRPV